MEPVVRSHADGFPVFVLTAAACGAFPFSCSACSAASTPCSPELERSFLCQGGGRGSTMGTSKWCSWGWCFGSFGCPPWHGRTGAPASRVPLSAALIPQLLSLHLTQLNIKASKHFSSSAQHCLPNYPPAGLSDCASCFPGCWQPSASLPAPLRGKPCSPNLPSHLSLQLLMPWGNLRYPKAVLACLSLFKGRGGAVCSSKAVLQVLTGE